MTAPQVHPGWCDVTVSCSAYADPEAVETLHRSRPGRIRKPLDDMTLYCFLVQDPTGGPVSVELAVLADPQPALWWFDGDVTRELSLEIPEAAELQDVLKSVLHLARRNP